MASETKYLKNKLDKITRESSAEIKFLRKHIVDYRAFVQNEIAILSNVVSRIDVDRDEFKESIRMLKYILRTPRLSRIY